MIPIQTIQTETFSMEYIHFGSGKKTMIILPGVSVQSVMSSAQLIADAYDIFTKDYTLYVFERRNHLPEDASIHSMAEDMHIVLSQLGLKDIYLFGVSLGGMIGLDLTIHHPEEIKAFALGSGVARLHEKSQSVLEHWISLASEGKVEDLELSFGQMVYPEPVFEQFKQTFIEMAVRVKPEELTQFIRCVSAVRSYDVLD
ncbi:MAG: alpha/beta hydrolase, partial [Erysipelotrichaceae bacterium]|nr:alpha/beta hydrolase [Erysipelotrichaceae bacterium]